MAKKIALDGEIGWEITSRVVKGILHSAGGEDIEVDWTSPGGSVFSGIRIFNLFKNYSGKVTFNIVGLAASMGSYIPLAADVLTAESNAVFMIHNARTFESGDHNDLRKTANILEGLSRLLSKEYTKKTGIDVGLIADMMDADTYLFGSEILEAGFVDSINGEEDPNPDAKTISFAAAKESFTASMQKLREEKPDDYEQVAALLPDIEGNAGSLLTDIIKPAKAESRDNHNTEVIVTMDINEVKAQHADIAAALIQEGVMMERDRVNAHLILGNASGDTKTAFAAVEDGSPMTETIKAKYQAAGMNKNDVAARLDDDDDETAAALAAVSSETNVETEADAVADGIEKKFGIVAEK